MVFTVYVVHKNEKTAYKCSTKRDFLTKILKNYGIIKDELVLIDNTSQKEIGLDDVCDDITVQVKARHAAVANGHSPSVEEKSFRPTDSQINDMILKLKENRVLTGLERKYIIKLAHEDMTCAPNRKRRREDEQTEEDEEKMSRPVQTANKKFQVELSDLKDCKSAYTQTDKLKTPAVEQNTSSNLVLESKLLAKKEKRDPKKVCEIMTKSYNERRNFILMQNPVVSLVKEKYPLLFSNSEVRNELNRIFYDGKDVEFLSNISKYATIILSLVQEDDSLLNMIHSKIKGSEKEKQYAREVGALLILSNVVKERRRYLETIDEPCEHNTYPRIEAPCKVKELFEDKHTFRIVVENLLFCEASSFTEAYLCLLACFFIFNISYPDKVFNTFVVLEKVFLDANDTDINDIDESTQQIVKLIQLKQSVKKK